MLAPYARRQHSVNADKCHSRCSGRCGSILKDQQLEPPDSLSFRLLDSSQFLHYPDG